MGNHTKGRRNRARAGGPSIWFFLALAIGIVLLIWMAVTVVRTPVKTRRTEIRVPANEVWCAGRPHPAIGRGEDTRAVMVAASL